MMPTDDFCVLPYTSKSQAHAAYVMHMEKDLDAHWAEESTENFFAQTLDVQNTVSGPGPDMHEGQEGDPSCDMDIYPVKDLLSSLNLAADDGLQVGDIPSKTKVEYRYGNPLMGVVGSLPVHRDICSYSHFNFCLLYTSDAADE